ncbi:hypothetical protein GQF03_14365 [Sneathiella chungangensis]|uniref:Phytanoyl-CoA dioxygenase n=1 Tax=Sneathiella chungangensis TaxID=1418234 RepID=A0A845MI82_9PROT|nr:phytanoyl-CoA dioxygenase family protein [Sneathiella chungangensis]MZR23519.1 hypothetical protein [Sneathiella chungangensis]
MHDTFTLKDWKALAPDLTIGEPMNVKEIPFPDAALAEISEKFWTDGYLALPPLFDAQEIEPVLETVYTLGRHGIPPVFIYLYDQPWWMFARLGRLIRHFLGENYAILPNLWAWHLSREGDAGWPPHRDCDAKTVFGTGDDRILMSLSLWLPLTDVDENNGCMYILPHGREETEDELTEIGKLNLLEATALPARAGCLLGWRQDVVHWGGRFGEAAKNPRVSLSFEFQNRAFAPLAEPLIDMSALPPFADRLALIQEQFAKYRHIDPVYSSRK